MHDRVPGSVRRATAIEMLRPDGLTGELVLHGRGRDIHTAPDGRARTLDKARLTVAIDYVGGRTVRAIHAEPDEPDLDALVGVRASSGFRRAAAAAAPAHAAAQDVLCQLLDDVPAACLISGYALSALGEHRIVRPHRLLDRADICSGFESGGTMMGLLTATGVAPLVPGPLAPMPFPDDPDGWLALAPLGENAMHRLRVLDVRPGGEGELRVSAWFRDSFRQPDGTETVVHEYEVDATVTTRDWAIRGITATPRVLPWPECPRAAASAGRLTGAPLENLREDVRNDFVGTTTCTHLNDQLRSLADVRALGEICIRRN